MPPYPDQDCLRWCTADCNMIHTSKLASGDKQGMHILSESAGVTVRFPRP